MHGHTSTCLSKFEEAFVEAARTVQCLYFALKLPSISSGLSKQPLGCLINIIGNPLYTGCSEEKFLFEMY